MMIVRVTLVVLTAVGLLLTLPPLAHCLTGRVVAVHDGDLITILDGSQEQHIRLNGIDCPEKGQPFGFQARHFTSELALGKDVIVGGWGEDARGWIVGDVYLPDGRSLNQELVKAGLAWWYRLYSGNQTLATLEDQARSARRGLWVDPHPVPPWEWRKLHDRAPARR